MAVLAPVLERKVNTDGEVTNEERRILTEDEVHNAQIRENYRRLINPDMNNVNDILSKSETPVSEPVRQVQQESESYNVNVVDNRPYLVQNARADADIFRADSAVNRVRDERDEAQEEEENEDLRPSPTTIQYKTEDMRKEAVIVDSISNREAKVSKLSKRDKIIMAVALLVIVALFVLVIINSAVLSNLNSEVSYLETDLVAAQQDLGEVLERKESYWDNIDETVASFAQQNGMSKNVGR